MLKQTCFLIGLTWVLILAGPVWAQGPDHSDPTWRAAYWNNTTLSGRPALERDEAALDHDWGSGSPDPSLSPNYFSARWTRYVYETPGTYRFRAISDDGVRVWLDGELIIDEWSEHPAQTFDVDVYLGGGHHLLTVEFYEWEGLAVARLDWALLSQDKETWQAEYYDNPNLSGEPALVRHDPQIDFDWGYGSPEPGIVGTDGFSVRWTGSLDLPAGSYRFVMTVDDGGRLWVNGHHLLEAWRDQAERTYTEEIYLPGGPVPVVMEYYERVERAVARLTWASTGELPPTPAGVIVDDSDPGFVTGGSTTGWRTATEGYDGHLTWTWNNDWARPRYNWARWYPHLEPGRYEVLVFIPERYTTTAAARYWVSHADGYTLRVIDQSIHGDEWVSLGTFDFTGMDTEYVSLSDVTYEPRLTRLIAFDAVKWAPRSNTKGTR